MRASLFIPLAAVLALAACNDKEASNRKTDTPSTTAAKLSATASAKTEPAAPAGSTAPKTVATAAAPSTSARPGATVGTGLKTADATGSVSANAPVLQPGRYQADPVALRLESGGKFVMTERDGHREVQGHYEYKDGLITFSDATGDLGKAKFPIRCKVEKAGDAFKFAEDAGACQALTNLTFRSAA